MKSSINELEIPANKQNRLEKNVVIKKKLNNGDKEEKKDFNYNSQNHIAILEKLQRKDYSFEENKENPINTIPREDIIMYLNEAQKTVLKWSLGQK